MSSTKTNLKVLISSGLLIATIFLTVQIVSLSKENQLLKIDLSEINHVRYGLLNVDEWSEKVAYIIIEKIEEFEITPENRDQLQSSLANVMYKLIDEVEELMAERTSGQFSGVKKWAAGLALDVDQLRDSVPRFSLMVLEELNKPESKEKMKGYILTKLDEFVSSTYNEDKMELLESLLQKYGCTDKQDCQSVLYEKLDNKQDAINYRVILILIFILFIFLVNLVSRGILNKYQVLVLILASLCLLISGVTTPMIELEARINMLLIKLVGEEVVFRDQILFFQSKSITDMVRILINDGSLQMIFVGVLIFTFSIVFPSLKLICSYIYYQNTGNLRESKLIRFFVLKAGKWSMADVMVVALFMAYIGFNGILDSQMDSLSRSTDPVEILSTNGTQLLGGFYLFLFFCLSSLVLSEALVRRSPRIDK